MKVSKKLTLKPGRRFEVNLASLSVIALLIFIPLYPKFPLFSIPETYVAVRAEDILVALVLFIFFLSHWRTGFPVLSERISRLIILYWLAGFLSLVSALLITKNIISHLSLLHFLRRIEYMSCFFVALSSIKKVRNVATQLFTLLLSTVGVIAYGFGQKFFDWPVVSTMTREFSEGLIGQLNDWTRVNATFAGHYDLAAYLVLVLAITLALLIWEKRAWLRILYVLFGLSALYLVVLTASRVSFVAYLIAVSLTTAWLKKPLWLAPVIGISLLFVLLSSDLTERYWVTISNLRFSLSSKENLSDVSLETDKIVASPTPSKIVTPTSHQDPPIKKTTRETTKPVTTPAATPTFGPLESVELAAQRSTDIRFKVEWPRAVKAFLKNPFLGTGYASISLATDNDYLRLLGETGILGFLSFGLIFLELFRKALFFLKNTPFSFEKTVVAGLLGGVAGVLANAFFIDVFEASKVAFTLWILIGILVGTINLKEKASGAG